MKRGRYKSRSVKGIKITMVELDAVAVTQTDVQLLEEECILV